MRLLIIRHADPDYKNDSLTEKGHREAELLSEYLVNENIDRVFVSPLGRAQRTAEYYLKASGKSSETISWLREFEGRCVRPDTGKEEICWDWLPQDWTERSCFYDRDSWWKDDAFMGTNVKSEYDLVTEGLDSLLSENGYERKGSIYKVKEANNGTIALFCHFGVECVILSHLIGASPMVLWHGTAAAPSTVTTVYTEERREGTASFRIAAFGDRSHLAIGNEPAAFSARFCECYRNKDERHD